MSIRFDDRVAVITGAGNGLGRAYALELAARGAKVVVNDLGGATGGGGGDRAAADAVVREIAAAGGVAIANHDSVIEGERIVGAALEAFGRVDILVNNAGILRDVSLHKMTDADWDSVYDVHVRGAFRTTQAAWEGFRSQGYGRVIFTASAAGIYGNFGQANYAAAKLGLVGLAQTLALEGKTKNIMVNTIAPIARSRLTEAVLPGPLLSMLSPELVAPLVLKLCAEGSQETGGLFEVGAGWIGKLRWERSKGVMFAGGGFTPEDVEDAWGRIADFAAADHPANVGEALGLMLAHTGG